MSTKASQERIDYCNKNPKLWWAYGTLKNHHKLGFTVNMAFRELFEYVKDIEVCADCGERLDWGYGHGKNKATPTLDRRDNEGAVKLGNIAIICTSCSSRKHTMAMTEWQLVKSRRLRRCSKCKVIKPLSEFARNKTTSTGYMSECKSCQYARTREWFSQHRNYKREWRAKRRREGKPAY